MVARNQRSDGVSGAAHPESLRRGRDGRGRPVEPLVVAAEGDAVAEEVIAVRRSRPAMSERAAGTWTSLRK